MIHVVAIMTAKPGCRAELLERFLAVLPIVHTEDGCIEYRPIIDNDAGLDGAREAIGPDTYIVIESGPAWKHSTRIARPTICASTAKKCAT